jgi:hypothetical protein
MITEAYFILGSGYVRYDAGADAVDPGYPKPIAGNWSRFSEIGFQDGIDAAVEWPNGKAYFFKGALYARYDIAGNRIELGYPLSIGDQWAGLAAAGFAEGIDAAVNWGNGKVYFFKGDQYVRYDIAADQADDGFPVHISDGWAGFAAAGFGSGLDTAVNWGNGKAYFFKGGLYLRYDIAADQMDDGYPQPISSGWPTLAAAGFGSGQRPPHSRELCSIAGGDEMCRRKSSRSNRPSLRRMVTSSWSSTRRRWPGWVVMD